MAHPSITRHLQRVSETHPDERVVKWAKDALWRLEVLRDGVEGEGLYDFYARNKLLETILTKPGAMFQEPKTFSTEDEVDDFITDQYDAIVPILREALVYWHERRLAHLESVENPPNG